MTYINIKNWQRWQSYRKDRGTPPWIKVHRNLLSNPEWAELTDAEKGQLVCLWILSADKDGQIPDNAKMLKKLCMLDREPNLAKLYALGFIEEVCLGVTVTPRRQPLDAPETETETETEEITTLCISPTEILKIYHEKTKLPRVQKLTSGRIKSATARIKERPEEKFWVEFWTKVSRSAFLNGSTDWHGCNFEWCLKESNFYKIIEGNYDNKDDTPQQQSYSPPVRPTCRMCQSFEDECSWRASGQEACDKYRSRQ